MQALTDIETIYRQRYVDLMSNKDSREVFVKRNKIVQSIRKNLEEAGFLRGGNPNDASYPRRCQC